MDFPPIPLPEEGASTTITADRHIPSSQSHRLVDDVDVHITPSENAPTPARKELQVAECLDSCQCEEAARNVTETKPRQLDHGPWDNVLFQEEPEISAATVPGSLMSTHQATPDPRIGSQSERKDLEVGLVRDGCDLCSCEAESSPLFVWEQVPLMESSEATKIFSNLVVEPVQIAEDTLPGVDSRQWNAGEEKIELSQDLKKFVGMNEVEQIKELDYMCVFQAVFVFASAGEKAGMFEPIALTKSSSDGPQLGSLS